MGVAEELGDDLARRTLEAMKDIDDDRFFYQVAKVIGASSPTLEEAYLTAMRIRLAAARGHKFLDDALKARRAGGSPGESGARTAQAASSATARAPVRACGWVCVMRVAIERQR